MNQKVEENKKLKSKEKAPSLKFRPCLNLYPYSYFFFWINPLISYSSRQYWEQDDYSPLSKSDLPSTQLSKIDRQIAKRNSIFSITFYAYPFEWLEILFSLTLSAVLRLVVAICTAEVIKMLEDKKDELQLTNSRIWIAIYFGVIVAANYSSTLLSDYYIYRTMRLTNKAKNGFLLKIIQSLISEKDLEENGHQSNYQSLGKIQNLFQIDSDNLDFTFLYVYFGVRDTIFMILAIPTAIYFIGFGVLFMILGIILSILLMYGLLRFRIFSQNKLLEAKDRRVNMLEDTISNLSSIKQMGLEKQYIKKLHKARGEEITQLRVLALQRLLSGFLEVYSVVLLSYPVYLSISYLLKNQFTFAEFSGYLQIQQRVLFGFIGLSVVANLSSSKGVSWSRFSQQISQIKKNMDIDKSQKGQSDEEDRIKDGKRNCFIKIEKIELKNDKNLVFIIGGNMSGKNQLLESVINHTTQIKREGQPIHFQKFGYMTQENWTFGASIEENIVMDRPLDQNLLEQCLNKVDLQDELKDFPEGIKTKLGEVSNSLSGGQISRVCLARTLYQQ